MEGSEGLLGRHMASKDDRVRTYHQRTSVGLREPVHVNVEFLVVTIERFTVGGALD